MKGLKKLTLASAIAVAPFASQAMEALDDVTMGDVTGQAGVTVEINIDGQISVGEIEYIDTRAAAAPVIADFAADPLAPTAAEQAAFDAADEAYQKSGGSVLIQNVRVSNVNDLVQTIDVNEDGDLELGVSGVQDVQIAVAGDGLTSAVALKSAGGDVTELVNNIDMQVDLGANTTYVRNLAGRTAAELTGTGAGELGLPADAAGGSVAIQTTAALRIDSMNVGAFGYTAAQSVVQGATVNGAIVATAADFTDVVGGPTAADQAATANAQGLAKADYLIAQYNASVAPADQVSTTTSAGTALTTEQQDAVNSVIANSAAVNIRGVQFYQDTSSQPGGSAKDYATIEQTIWAKGGTAELGGGVYIQIGEINGTLEVGAIELGGASIGAVKVSNINLSGLTQRIYGHQ